MPSKQVDLQKYEEGGIILTTEITRGGIELGKKSATFFLFFAESSGNELGCQHPTGESPAKKNRVVLLWRGHFPVSSLGNAYLHTLLCRYVSAIPTNRKVDPGVVLPLLRSHPLFSKAEVCIANTLPHLQSRTGVGLTVIPLLHPQKVL